jgi:hypothetical protein
MAIPDHTARLRPSVCIEPESDVIVDTDLPLDLPGGAQYEQETFTARLTGAMLGVRVIQGLLDRWLTEQRAQACGLPLPKPKPLTVKQVSGLNAALSVLRDHSHRIRSELIE